MKINNLILFNFRSYEYTQVEFGEQTNVIFGFNGQGKTSLLEAIALFALGKSMKSHQDKDMIRFGQEVAQLRLMIQTQGSVDQLAMKISAKGKQILINQVKKKSLTELIGKLRVILFTPDDLAMIKDGPETRRKFVNQYLAQISPDYIKNLREYNQLLNQRNQLLKQNQVSAIPTWDESLSRTGIKIIMARKEFLNRIQALAKERYYEIANAEDELTLTYKPAINAEQPDKLIHIMMEQLRNSLLKDLEKGYTSIGPHRDDINFEINQMSASRFASQGQIRTAVLATKFAILDYFYESIGDYPILLLDDVMSELDDRRRKALFALMKKTQTIMTTSNDRDLIELQTCSLFEVAHGIIKNKE